MKFIKYILSASAVSFLLALYPVFFSSGENTMPFLYGYAIALVNVILGYGLIEYSIDKSMKTFMLLVFGGMFVRMVFVGALLLIVYKAANVNLVTLLLTVMFFYFLFAAIEIFYVNKRKPSNIVKENRI